MWVEGAINPYRATGAIVAGYGLPLLEGKRVAHWRFGGIAEWKFGRVFADCTMRFPEGEDAGDCVAIGGPSFGMRPPRQDERARGSGVDVILEIIVFRHRRIFERQAYRRHFASAKYIAGDLNICRPSFAFCDFSEIEAVAVGDEEVVHDSDSVGVMAIDAHGPRMPERLGFSGFLGCGDQLGAAGQEYVAVNKSRCLARVIVHFKKDVLAPVARKDVAVYPGVLPRVVQPEPHALVVHEPVLLDMYVIDQMRLDSACFVGGVGEGIVSGEEIIANSNAGISEPHRADCAIIFEDVAFDLMKTDFGLWRILLLRGFVVIRDRLFTPAVTADAEGQANGFGMAKDVVSDDPMVAAARADHAALGIAPLGPEVGGKLVRAVLENKPAHFDVTKSLMFGAKDASTRGQFDQMFLWRLVPQINQNAIRGGVKPPCIFCLGEFLARGGLAQGQAVDEDLTEGPLD